MRVLILTFGTQGDIRPFVALAKGLRAAGHEAGVCTAEGFRNLVVGAGIDYVHMGNEMLDLVQSEMPRMGGASDALRLVSRMSAAMRSGSPISFWEFTKKGAIVTVVTILLAAPYLWLRYFAFAG